MVTVSASTFKAGAALGTVFMAAQATEISGDGLSGLLIGGGTGAALVGIIGYLVGKFIPSLLAEHREVVKVLTEAQTNERKEHREELQGAVDAIKENTVATRQLADAVNKIAKG